MNRCSVKNVFHFVIYVHEKAKMTELDRNGKTLLLYRGPLFEPNYQITTKTNIFSFSLQITNAA